jgi:hypothetical protein
MNVFFVPDPIYLFSSGEDSSRGTEKRATKKENANTELFH